MIFVAPPEGSKLGPSRCEVEQRSSSTPLEFAAVASFLSILRPAPIWGRCGVRNWDTFYVLGRVSAETLTSLVHSAHLVRWFASPVRLRHALTSGAPSARKLRLHDLSSENDLHLLSAQDLLLMSRLPLRPLSPRQQPPPLWSARDPDRWKPLRPQHLHFSLLHRRSCSRSHRDHRCQFRDKGCVCYRAPTSTWSDVVAKVSTAETYLTILASNGEPTAANSGILSTRITSIGLPLRLPISGSKS